MTWTQSTLDASLEAARTVVRGDGADLVLVKADERRARIDLKLDVENLTCEDGTCLLPGRLLKPMIEAKMREHIAGEWELRLADPREGAA
jgi:hypothetical protein